MNRRLHVAIGINAYPGGNALRGCVNDALGWASLAGRAGYESETLLDASATRGNILEALRSAVTRLRWADRLLVTYSGHGSWVADTTGDEPDGRDECLVPVDLVPIIDDDLQRVLAERALGSRVVLVSDSCHSGTVSRFLEPPELVYGGRPRYFPHEELVGKWAPEPHWRRRAIGSRTEVALMSGCGDLEFSYDASIGGIAQGAFSEVAIRTWSPGISLRDWHRLIRLNLPSSSYPQSPELTAAVWQRRWSL